MADVFSPEKRSSIMSCVKGRNTKPEMVVRSLIHRMGFRFRLHGRDLPGNPDIVLPRHRKVVFVHGCFWHGHSGCPRSKRPTTNNDFWAKKLDGNIDRDRRFQDELVRARWNVLVIWQCEMKDLSKLIQKLEAFLNDRAT